MKKKATLFCTSIIFFFGLSSSLLAQPFNKFASFDGIDDYLQGSNILPSGDWTVEFFFRSCEVGIYNYRTFLTNNSKFAFYFNQYTDSDEDTLSHHTYEFCFDESAIDISCLQGYDFEGLEDAWVHVVFSYSNFYNRMGFTWNGGTLGLSEFDDNIAPGENFLFGKAFSLWASITEENLMGYIDEMRISDTLRYEEGVFFTPPSVPFETDANTIALYHFDEIEITPSLITDNSGNGNALEVNGELQIQSMYDATIVGPLTVSAYSENIYTSIDLPEYYTAQWISTGATIENTDDPRAASISWETTGTYTLTLNIIDEITGCTISSQEITITVEQGQGLGDMQSIEMLIYPTITNDGLFIESENNIIQNLHIHLTDINGNLILKKNMNPGVSNVQIDLSGIPNGVYFISISNGYTVVKSKIIKQ